jgi:WD repeat-containing protein 1 (actin-interacting protein 1)
MASGSGAPDVSVYGPRAGFLVPLPGAERGVASVLGVSPDGKFLAYGSGSVVVVRSIDNPSLAFAYSDHNDTVKSAKFAPTGKYIASGDAAGKVRVWAFTQAEHSLKYELPSIGGPVEDLAWDSEAKRIIVVGGGQAKAKVFAWDTGSQLGEIVPHSKKNLTCDFKPTRPFKAVFGGEDFSLSFYQGPPFKYEKGLKEHTNFVNCVKYSPDGSKFISVSSDKQGIVYDGTTAAVIGKLDTATGHAGSIYSVAWSADGTRVVTSGGDKTVKMWDMTGAGPTFPCISTFTLGKAVEDMQESIVWPNSELVVSLSLVS